MADRGRRARPISSRICDEKYQEHCDKLHRERIANMKGRSDHSRPKSMDFTHMKTGNNAKKNYLDSRRKYTINLENTRLLDKMEEINKTKIEFKPWYARTTLGFKAGYYYDSRTAQAVTDHHLRLLPSQPRGGVSSYAKKTEMLDIFKENHKILDAMQRGKPQIRFDKFKKEFDRNTEYLDRLSMYHGPESARFRPTWRRHSARESNRFNGLGGNHSPRQSPMLPTRRYEEMLNFRPYTAPSSHVAKGSSSHSSRPAVAATGSSDEPIENKQAPLSPEKSFPNAPSATASDLPQPSDNRDSHSSRGEEEDKEGKQEEESPVGKERDEPNSAELVE